jgi:hypothetical protein
MNKENRFTNPQQKGESTSRKPWKTPAVEVLPIRQTREGNTDPSSDIDTLYS